MSSPVTRPRWHCVRPGRWRCGLFHVQRHRGEDTWALWMAAPPELTEFPDSRYHLGWYDTLGDLKAACERAAARRPGLFVEDDNE